MDKAGITFSHFEANCRLIMDNDRQMAGIISLRNADIADFIIPRHDGNLVHGGVTGSTDWSEFITMFY